MTTQPAYRRKLIEIDLPLNEINLESRKDASQASGHPSTLHKYWARRPLAACRAVIFASMVDDPIDCVDEFPDRESQDAERKRLHSLIGRLVKWKDSSDLNLLAEARWEIARSVARSLGEAPPDKSSPDMVMHYLSIKALPIYDPFCGGGSIPLEAQRLGMRAIGSDLNPVAVLITKALIELPPKFANLPPINPEGDKMGMTVGKGKKAEKLPWRGPAGLANDVRYYGRKMREMAWERIGHLYPTVKLTDGKEATVTVWMWARTIPCPNPACGVKMPLVGSFQLAKNEPVHWIKPVVDRESSTISWIVQNHQADVPSSSTASKTGAQCVACNQPVKADYIREQTRLGNMNYQMTAVIASSGGQRVYRAPTDGDITAATTASPPWKPDTPLPDVATKAISLQSYGWTHWHQIFTDRQLLTLTTFSDLISEARRLLKEDGASNDYINAVATYLSFAISRTADSGCTFTVWESSGNKVAAAFSRQGLGMVWDFPEANPFSNATQNWMSQVEWIAKVIERLPSGVNEGIVYQADAAKTLCANKGPIIVTDPPYYASVFYSDTSDFFYAWLRHLLRDIHSDLFAGILTPKEEEIIANRNRFKDSDKRFEDLLSMALHLIRQHCDDEFPSSIFYAYKQEEVERDGSPSSGWETMLNAVIRAGFQIVSTWPMRTENPRALKSNRNALASSVVLVCRPRPQNAPVATRRQFLDALESELPASLDHLTREGHIAPVDLAQAAIGPGMQIFSRYSRVETISGEEVPVRAALAEINRVIAEYDEQAQGELDRETRFCVDWLKQYGYSAGNYSQAEDLARAKGSAVGSLRDHQRLLEAPPGTGQANLLPEDEYGPNRRLGLQEMTAWEGCFRMAYDLDPNREDGAGIDGAATTARAMGTNAESVERLARILYNHYDRKGDSRNSVKFNNLVTEWPQILQRAQEPGQERLV